MHSHTIDDDSGNFRFKVNLVQGESNTMKVESTEFIPKANIPLPPKPGKYVGVLTFANGMTITLTNLGYAASTNMVDTLSNLARTIPHFRDSRPELISVSIGLADDSLPEKPVTPPTGDTEGEELFPAISPAISSITTDLNKSERLELVRLQTFKSFVHSHLTAMGVPENPGGKHTNVGCRIGDRLDWLKRTIDAYEGDQDSF